MKKLVAFTIVALVAQPSLAEQPTRTSKAGASAGATSPVPPEVKRTIDAFVGTWAFDGKITGLPGANGPAAMTETIVCKKGGGGRVASCSGKATIAGIGPVQEEALIAWDAGARKVRFVGMNSMGEVHDHTCSWNDERTLACEPLSVTSEGQPATVNLVFTWTDPRHLTFRETTAMKDGANVASEGTATRK